MKGSVEFFNNVAGWGVIKGEDKKSYFIHHTDIVDGRFFPTTGPDKFRTLKDGQAVSFNVDTMVDDKLDAARHLEILK